MNGTSNPTEEIIYFTHERKKQATGDTCWRENYKQCSKMLIICEITTSKMLPELLIWKGKFFERRNTLKW